MYHDYFVNDKTNIFVIIYYDDTIVKFIILLLNL